MYDPVGDRIDQAVDVLAHYLDKPERSANRDFRAEIEDAVRKIVDAAVIEATEALKQKVSAE